MVGNVAQKNLKHFADSCLFIAALTLADMSDILFSVLTRRYPVRVVNTADHSIFLMSTVVSGSVSRTSCQTVLITRAPELI